MSFKKILTSAALSIFTTLSYAQEINLDVEETSAAVSEEQQVNEVTLSQQATDEELAAIYMISEFCPSLLEEQQQSAFEESFAKLVAEYLPKQPQALGYLKLLSSQQTFQPYLNQAKSDVAQAGDEKNRAICQDLVTYYK